MIQGFFGCFISCSLHLLCKGSVSMEDFISKFSGTDGTILMIYLINASDELPQLNVSRWNPWRCEVKWRHHVKKGREPRVISELRLSSSWSTAEETSCWGRLDTWRFLNGFCYLLLITVLGCFSKKWKMIGCLLGIQQFPHKEREEERNTSVS